MSDASLRVLLPSMPERNFDGPNRQGTGERHHDMPRLSRSSRTADADLLLEDVEEELRVAAAILAHALVDRANGRQKLSILSPAGFPLSHTEVT